jgi:hypothetical protein
MSKDTVAKKESVPIPAHGSEEWKRWVFKEFSKPFPEEAIERTKGSETRKNYDTAGIRYAFVTQRLNDVVGLHGWRMSHRIIKEEEFRTAKGKPMYEVTTNVVVELLLDEKPWCSRDAYGGHSSLVLADAYKGAITNALKKACGFLGVAWKAFAGQLDDDSVPIPEKGSASTQSGRPAAQKPRRTGYRPSESQKELLERYAEMMGSDVCRSVRADRHLVTSDDVNQLIEDLQAEFERQSDAAMVRDGEEADHEK